jgi:aryl-alcohol dehydrogenase-like predicted oxidoreductase
MERRPLGASDLVVTTVLFGATSSAQIAENVKALAVGAETVQRVLSL